MNVHDLQSFLVPLVLVSPVLFLWARDRRALKRISVQLATAAQTQAAQSRLLSERASLDSVKDEFVATVSHELKTPLTSIHGALRLLSSGLLGVLEPKADNLLRIAISNTDRLIRLTNDILDLQRMEAGQAQVSLSRCALRELAQQAIDTMSPAAEAAQVHLLLTAPDRSEVDLAYFDGDADSIMQILTNLLSNAIKFSPSGAAVRVHVSSRASSVLLRVEDNGRGIPPDKLDTVFDRFQQVDRSDAREKKGTGLGLAICRSIVHQHNGRIWAQPNDSGPGTSFWVELPRNGRATDSKALAPVLVRDPQGRILICDDDHHVRVVISEQLRGLGYTVAEAESGERALEIVDTHPIDLLLLDLYMPALSGWETLRRLRAKPATATMPVVILSVLSRQSSPATRQLIGLTATPNVQGWIEKPVDEQALAAEIHQALHPVDTRTHILFVGNDSILATAVHATLDKTDFVVHHATSRQRAIEHCMQARPDLLILDLGLPDGDGFSLTSWLHGRPALRAMPLVVYSAREISESEKAQLRLGPTRFVLKSAVPPGKMDELALSLIRQAKSARVEETLSA